ncbi:hypothetical protein D3C78_844900 [compost metagenome]
MVHGLSPGAGSFSCPRASSGHLACGLSVPVRFSERSSRASDSESIRRPSPSQCAVACRSLSCSLPSRRKLPSQTSPSCSDSGGSSSGRLIGPDDSSAGVSGRSSSTRSARSLSRHRVRRSRQDGDQSSSGLSSCSRVSVSVHCTLRALQCPPRRPWNSSTSSPGTRPSAQRLPVSLPRIRPIASASRSSRPSTTPARINSARFTARAPWRSGYGNRRPHPGRWRGRGAAGRPARPSARRCRRRS